MTITYFSYAVLYALQYPSQLPPGPPPAVMYPQQQPTTVVAPGLFDAGARFDGMSQHRIPVSL